MYYLPGEDGTSDRSFPVSLNDLITVQLHCRQASILACSDDMVKLGIILLKQENLSIPKIVDDLEIILTYCCVSLLGIVNHFVVSKIHY